MLSAQDVSRTGPRKHGHGKGNTGVPGEESEEGEMELDPRDPDYEDEEDEADQEQKPAAGAHKVEADGQAHTST